MKMLFALVATSFLSLPALAMTDGNNGPYERYPYYSTDVSCAELQQAVMDAGALVVYRSPVLYDLHASNSGNCGGNQELKSFYVPTMDGQCYLPRCGQINHGDNN